MIEGIFFGKMERLTVNHIRLLQPAFSRRLDLADDCNGCFNPLGNEPRTRIISYEFLSDAEPVAVKAEIFYQHERCFQAGVPVMPLEVKNA